MRGRCGNAENFALTAKERKAHAPKPLPEIRPGALTPPLPLTQPPTLKSWSLFSKIKFSTRQETSDQLQSALIKKLPIELRQRIWRQVVGEKLLHVIRAHRTLLAIECPGRASLRSSTKHYACWGITSRNIELGPVPGYYITPQLSSTARHTSLLSLLKTCRLIYSEAIDYLYIDNKFAFDHIDTLLYLSITLLPYRLRLIRCLLLDWVIKYPMIPLNPTSQSTRKSDTWPPPPYDEGTWREAWAVISRMMDLRQIRVHLSGQGIPLRKDPFRHLLEPLHEIRHAAVFELTVASGPDVEFINAPFKIFRASE